MRRVDRHLHRLLDLVVREMSVHLEEHDLAGSRDDRHGSIRVPEVVLFLVQVDADDAVDLNKEEDNFRDADCPMAIVPRTGEIVLLQMDGHLTYDEFQKAMEMSIDATHRLYELQRDALRRRYSTTLEDILKESPPVPPPPMPESELPP